MHFLVTGASGFIGTSLCEEAVKRGHQVTALIHESPLRPELSMKGIKSISGDLEDQSNLSEAFKHLESVDCVFHLGGQTRRKDLPAETYYQKNSLGTLHILECCRIFNIKKVIIGSTAAVYGLPYKQFQADYLPIDERHRTNVYPGDFYALSKVFAEQFSKSYHDMFGLTAIIFRISRVYGSGSRGGSIHKAATQSRSNLPIVFDGDGYVDPVFIDDVASAFLSASHWVNQFEIYNIGSGEETTLREICEKIIRLTKSSSELKFKKEANAKFSLDVSKAKKDFTYEPTKLDDGLTKWLAV